jgi:hypothetical protein
MQSAFRHVKHYDSEITAPMNQRIFADDYSAAG